MSARDLRFLQVGRPGAAVIATGYECRLDFEHVEGLVEQPFDGSRGPRVAPRVDLDGQAESAALHAAVPPEEDQRSAAALSSQMS